MTGIEIREARLKSLLAKKNSKIAKLKAEVAAMEKKLRDAKYGASVKRRTPLAAGTEIDYRGLRAIVIKDDGGDTLTVDSENIVQEWEWELDGAKCTVVKGV